MLNAPPKQVIGNNGFGRGVELVGNEDVTRIIVILIPLAQNNYKLDGNLTIFQFCLKRVRSMRNFRAIRGLILDCFGFVPIMLLMRVTSSSGLTQHFVLFIGWYMKIFLFDPRFHEDMFISEKKIFFLVWICSRRSVVAYQESKVNGREFNGF